MKSTSSLAFNLFCVLLLGVALPAQAQDKPLSSGADLNWNDRFPPPAPLYSDLLNALQSQVTWQTGVLQIDGNIRALFLPDFHDPQHIAPYNHTTGARLAHQIKRLDGTVVETQFYEGRKDKAPFWVMYPNLPPDQALAAGDYVLEFLVEGTPFYQFPFTVEVTESDDPYNPETRYYFEGPWDDYAYLYIPENNPAATPMFSIWLRDKASSLGNKTSRGMNVKVKRGGQVVAFWPDFRRSNPVDFPPYWERLDVTLRNDGSGSFSAADIMKDGSYEVVVSVEDKPYATYRYTAQGGKIQHQDRQVRDATDAMAYIEGDTQRYFMKRVR